MPRRFSLCVACGFVGPVPPQVPPRTLVERWSHSVRVHEAPDSHSSSSGHSCRGELWPDPIGRPVIRFRRALLRHMSRANVPPPTLPALPPDLTRLVLSFLDDVRSIARVRCVSRTLRAIAGSDEVWKRFVPSHGLTACGWRLPSHPELSCFRRVEMFRRKCPHCETAANPFDGPLPFSIPPDRMLQLRKP